MKIITHAALIVAQDKNDRFRVLGRGICSKNKQHSPPDSLSVSSTKVPATRLEKRSRTSQSIGIQGCVAHLRKNHHRLLLRNRNVLTLAGKELKLVEETPSIQY